MLVLRYALDAERCIQTKLRDSPRARSYKVARSPAQHRIATQPSLSNRFRLAPPPTPPRALPDTPLTIYMHRVGRPAVAGCSSKGLACAAWRPHLLPPRPPLRPPGGSGPGTTAKLNFRPVGQPLVDRDYIPPCGPWWCTHVCLGAFWLCPCVECRNCDVGLSSCVAWVGAGCAGSTSRAAAGTLFVIPAASQVAHFSTVAYGQPCFTGQLYGDRLGLGSWMGGGGGVG